jgi:hypothetical protein
MSLRISASSRRASRFALLFALGAPACGQSAEPAGAESLAGISSTSSSAEPGSNSAASPPGTEAPTQPAASGAPSASVAAGPVQLPDTEPAVTPALPLMPPQASASSDQPEPQVEPEIPAQMEPEEPQEPAEEMDPEEPAPEVEPEEPQEPAEEMDPEVEEEPAEEMDPEVEEPVEEPAPPEEEGNVIQGQGGVVDATIVVRAGEIFDGGGQTFTAGGALGDGSQDESQDPVFRLEDGAQLRNVVLGSPAADGIHCYGDVALQNIDWLDIGEDALTIKESGTVTLDGGSAMNGEDKVFQINAASTFIVKNFTARSAGKFIRQNGDTTFKVDVVIDSCDISQMDESIFRTDSDSSTVTMTNTRYSEIGDALFLGVNPNNITESNNTAY